MMDQIIITLVLISIFCNANGQLQCFVCTDCPHANELDYTVSQRCDGFTSPNTQTTPTITPTEDGSPTNTQPFPTTTSTSTVTDDNGLPTNTQPFPTTTSTITVTEENGSPPNTPPTPTTTSRTTVIEENETPLNAIRTNRSHEEETKQPTRFLHILSQSQLSEIHHCFRIERIVNDERQVVRGCVVTANSLHSTCVKANSGVAPIRCRICQFDNCNSARRNRTTSIIIILFTSFISMTFFR